MTTPHFTKSAIRAAILRAADRIERDPGSYQFVNSWIASCGTPHCMWGWIGYELGFTGCSISDVYEALDANDMDLYTICEPGYTVSPTLAAEGMRAYAAKYFPIDEGPLCAYDLIPLADFNQWLDCIRAGAAVESVDEVAP